MLIDLTGQRFGRLRVLRMAPRKAGVKPFWKCRCTCGTVCVVSGFGLRQGSTKSCGCYHKDRSRETVIERCTTHGHAGRGSKRSGEYRAWSHMHDRCYSVSTYNYCDYGGRGIRVCRRWFKFENFLADMGRKPNPRHSLDREDNNKNYTPTNCRWATPREQARNKRNNRELTHAGKTQKLIAWADAIGMKAHTLRARVFDYKWSTERALTERVRPWGDRS